MNLFSITGGYIIYGQLPCGKSESTVGVNTVVMSKIQVQDQMVDSCLLQDLPKPPIHNLWELDTIGIKEDSLTVGERYAVDFFTKSIQLMVISIGSAYPGKGIRQRFQRIIIWLSAN